MGQTLRPTKFKDVDLEDKFFDSLKAQYAEFSAWFNRKANEPVYVVDDDAGGVRGFLYIKVETGEITDVQPTLPAKRRLKVGTLKVNAKGTKLGERIIKRIFDHAVLEDVDEVYVTVFDTHASLIKLFERYGFQQKGIKKTPNGEELVLLRSLRMMVGDIVKDYPLMHTAGKSKWLLAIKPEYHTRLLPDSILRTEDPASEEDVPHTNSIHKVYIAGLVLTRMKRGDLIVFYRTTDKPGHAWFRSVATSVCVVEDTFSGKHFPNADAFIGFCKDHSVFTEQELRDRFTDGKPLYVAKLTYNSAFAKRPTRGTLMDDVGITEYPRWDLRSLTDGQFTRILDLGEVDESLIVD
ncbi:GNAT family N-acetyltransferase [Rhizobium leguminosarum]|uniref:N-acetyltransferase n=1 Tax=Rhizobium leguminosarum TaxID=384 RepID=A0ABD7PUH4_RHILE|nr:N-acetyltransferase [Rhizobium leguminosarum]TAV75001.1 N-acetyltransferase [Rhizobium leguminosarum]TAV79601.1 N-acetyltransferase [Rhizobium leguminosarum]TAW30937.1 N-acetyltransferase [Rhizobium leguminosarum]TAW44664.1 N-acetyltransferase [Rhizobium leguminosarum]TAZ31332.1 N-acetyltransferase [Rhizobium leguminosarum]